MNERGMGKSERSSAAVAGKSQLLSLLQSRAISSPRNSRHCRSTAPVGNGSRALCQCEEFEDLSSVRALGGCAGPWAARSHPGKDGGTVAEPSEASSCYVFAPTVVGWATLKF